jgi:murein DD-endopeptidase MepM/ murein hydrolase activator NlpD
MRPSGHAPARRGLRTVLATAVAVISLCVGVAAALAEGGGVTPPKSPKASDVVCISTCGGVRKATTHSQVQITGRHLKQIDAVEFTARSGARISVKPASTSSHAVTAKVPDGAATGRPKVTDLYDNSATVRAELQIISPSQIPSSADFKLKSVSATPRKAYYYGLKKPKVTYMFTNSQPTDVRIDVVSRKDGTLADTWVRHNQEPNTIHTATWKGLKGGPSKPALNGSYRFRVGPESGRTESAAKATFAYHRFEFPVRGRHSYGDGVGAPRVGHVHEGQDVLAACNTKLVAARGGRVQWKAYQGSGAGNYIVIDGKKTSHDWMYAHLKKPSTLHKGQRVRTGQKIGVVGATGDASGCHLHIEEWSGPGWYEGGHYLRSITKHLKQWDKWS